MRTTIILLLAAVVGATFGSGLAAWSFYRLPEQISPELGLVPPQSDPSDKLPTVKVDKEEYDFGSMDSHATGSHEFVFSNVGEGPLELEAGQTTCKCTLSDIGNGVILPGESGTVTLEWQGKDRVGPYAQTATIITNDPKNPRVKLSIQGEMTAKARVVPDILIFSSVTAGQTAHGDVRIFGYLDQPLEITGYEIDDPESVEISFSAMPEDEIKGEKYATSGQRMDVTLKPGLPLGPFTRRIRVMTSVEGLEELAVPVQGTVSSEISILGPGWSSENGVLRFGSLGKSKVVRKLLVKVDGLHSDEVRFEVVEVQPEFVKVRLGDKTNSPGGHATVTPIEIEIPEGSPPCNHFGPKREKLGRIRLTTTHATVPELNIYLQFLISG